MDIESNSCGIFEVLSHHQEVEAIYPTTFAEFSGLGDKIKKLVSSNFM